MIWLLAGFLGGVWFGVAVFLINTAGADPEGRFKLRYALLWPFYLKRIFYGE